MIAHGASEHSGRYGRRRARCASGYAVHALDHRGHGRSEGARALLDRMDNAVADLDSLIVLAADEHPGSKLFLLGHSMGGDFAALRDAPPGSPRGADPVSSARGARGGPGATAAGGPVPSAGGAPGWSPSTSSSTPRLRRSSALYVADPLVHHGKLPARTVAELADAVDGFPSGR